MEHCVTGARKFLYRAERGPRWDGERGLGGYVLVVWAFVASLGILLEPQIWCCAPWLPT